MYAFILRVISCLCIFQGGVFSEECSQGVFGKRETFFVPAGGSLSLSCVVQHCGRNWTGNWKRKNSTTSITVENSARHSFTIAPVSANQSKPHLKILSVRQSDEGFYTCNVKWSDGSHDVSHWMQVNVTKGVALERKLLHRILVCTGAFLCLPVILGLARCLSSEVKQQPHPRIEVLLADGHEDRSHQPPQPPPRRPVPKKRTAPPHKAPSPPQQKPEVFLTAEDRRWKYGAVGSKEHACSDSGEKKKPPFNRTRPPAESGSVQAAIDLDRLGVRKSRMHKKKQMK